MDSGSDWDSFSGSSSLPSNSVLKPKNQEKIENKVNGKANPGFQSVELEDKSQLHERIDRSTKKRKEKISMPISRADQPPYTQFEANPQNTEQSHYMDNNTKHGERKNKYIKDFGNQNHQESDEINNNSWDLDNTYNDDVGGHPDTVYGDSTLKDDPPQSVKRYSLKDTGFERQPAKTNNSPTMDPLPLISSKKKSIRSKYVSKETSNNNNNNDETLNINDNTQVVNDYEKQWWTLNRCETVLMMPEKELEILSGVKKNHRSERFSYEKSYYNVYTVQEAKRRKVSTFGQEEINPQIQRVWQEISGVLQIILDFFIIFLLEMLKLFFVTVFKKLVVGIIKLVGDHALKPLFTAIFNSLLQPSFVLFWNTTTGIRNILQPLVYLLGDISIPLSNLIRAFRLVEYKSDRVSNSP